MRVLFIDNYDSFVWNIVHYFGELGAEVEVFRNDAISTQEIAEKNPDAIVISPGPASPNEAGICLDVVAQFAGKIPLFGVCLGCQTMGQVCGGSVVRAPKMFHGKTSPILHEGRSVFKGLPNPLTATRYHSLIVTEAGLGPEIDIDARTEDGIIMGISHRKQPVYGVQFHPESFATEHGHALIQNFLDLAKAWNAANRG